MSAHFDIISIGESTVDAFMALHDAVHNAHLHDQELCFRFGAKIEVDKYSWLMGGNATNVAVGISRLGLKATLFSEIGDDELSLLINNSLAKENVDRSHIIRAKNSTSSFSVIINFRDDRTLFVQDVEREHNFHFSDISSKWMYITSLGKEWRKPYEKALEFAAKNNIKIAFNPGSRQLREGKDMVEKVIKNTDILFLNKEEAEKLIYHEDIKAVDNEKEYIRALADALAERGARVVVITNGKKGAYTLDFDGKFYHQPNTPGPVVERTGAGDAFTCGFIGATLYGLPVSEAMRWGAVNATSVVGAVGAEAGLLTKSQAEKKVKEIKDLGL